MTARTLKWLQTIIVNRGFDREARWKRPRQNQADVSQIALELDLP